MTQQTFEQVVYDPSGALIGGIGITSEELAEMTPNLEAARDEVLADLELWHTGSEAPREKRPLEPGFIDLPERLLAEYEQAPGTSEIGRILTAAQRLSEMVDRVVVIGIGGSYMGSRSLLEACCHPYYDELDRTQRNDRPRMYFAGYTVDNDLTQGLMDLLDRKRPLHTVDERWGIIVVSKSGGTLEPVIAFRQFLNALRQSVANDSELLARLVIPVVGFGSNLHKMVTELGCEAIFPVPEGIGGRFSIFSAVGLLPAAVLGIDIVKLLQGAALMNKRFRESPAGNNPVLDYVGVCQLMEARHGANIRVLSLWNESLEALGLWYDQLLSESLGKQERGATPLTVVNTRDLHSRGQQHQEGRRDKLITNIIINHARRKPLPIGHSVMNHDDLNKLADKSLLDIATAAVIGANRAYNEDRRPTTNIHLPYLDEVSLGQLYQMLMLATSVEGRLIGINPYGQPGVEAYKKHMRSILQSG